MGVTMAHRFEESDKGRAIDWANLGRRSSRLPAVVAPRSSPQASLTGYEVYIENEVEIVVSARQHLFTRGRRQLR